MMFEHLEDIWSSLAVPTAHEGISGRRPRGLPHCQGAYLAVDGEERRHLLVLVPDGTDPMTQRDTRGLQVSTERFQVGSNPEALYIDLACTDSLQNPTFTAVVQDLLRALSKSSGLARDAVVGALSRWRAFWSSRSARLSREEALGLFGELWFLRRWVAPMNAESLSAWQATPRARHDFQWPQASVEVKTGATRSSEGPVHRISGLEQLDDPVEGQLYLFSLQVTDDALAANTLPALVGGLVEELSGNDEAITLLNEKLAGYGYSPSDAQAYQRPLRVIGERLYRVTEAFPRLTSRTFQPGLPEGIGDVTYTLATAACGRWLVARTPSDPGASFLR